MDRLTQVANTLRVLVIKGASRLTAQGIKNALLNLNRLDLLDVKYDCVDNSHLDLAIEIVNNNNASPHRTLRIYCDGGLIDTTEFIFKYPETIRSNLEFNYYRFKYGNLTFETSLKSQTTNVGFSRRLQQNESSASWKDAANNGGIIFIGSSSDSDDEEQFMNFDNFNFKRDAAPNNERAREYEYYDDDDDGDGDDLAEFEYDEQEMYNELDEY